MTDHCRSVRELLHAFWESRWDECMAHFAEGVLYEDPLLDEPVRGKQRVLEVFKYCHSWGGYRGEIRNVYCSDRAATAELRIRGRVTSPPEGMPDSVVGKEFDFAEADVFEFDDSGRVVRETIYADVYTFMRQIGQLAEPAPASAP